MDNIKLQKKLISVVLLTKNEEKLLEKCFKSISFCAEIIVVDDNSTDQTRHVAEKLGAKVFIRDLKGNFAKQLNFGMEKTKNELVLFLDPDEVISDNLRDEITKIFLEESIYQIPKRQGLNYSFRRIDFVWNKWIRNGEVGAFRSTRLVHKNSGKWVRGVHQFFESNYQVREFVNPILHFPHPSLSKFISNINHWSTLHAIENYKEKKKSGLIKIIVFPAGHFVRNFIFRMGFMDGMHGFIYALVMSTHSFLAWGKLYMLQKGLSKV